MKTYYIANPEYADKIYGFETPVCLDLNEVQRLAREWDMTAEALLEQMHEATPAEVREYGSYDYN